MGSKHMKRVSADSSLGNSNKSTMKYDFAPTILAIIWKKNTSVIEDVEESEPSHFAFGNVKWIGHCGKPFGRSLKS